MYSRKIALSLAKQYRTCPPPRIQADATQKKACENHRAVCPYCSGQDREALRAWDVLEQQMNRVDSSVEKTSPDNNPPARAGQLRYVRPESGLWREKHFYTPPVVLVIQNTISIPGAVLVAQTYHDIQMAAPGDLIVTNDDSACGPLFVECWNTYTIEETLLGPPLDNLPDQVLEAVQAYESRPDFCPGWAMLPRPLGENDARGFFRELELEVAYTFSSRSVLQLMKAFELSPSCSSPPQLQEAILRAVPGTGWKRVPRSAEEVFAMAALPVENLPLAAGDPVPDERTANLVHMEGGRVKSLIPVPMEIIGQSGELTLSGRIHGLPEDFNHSRFICFLQPESKGPIVPVRCEWKEETGDFVAEFSYQGNAVWHLKAAVVFEPAQKQDA